MRKEKVESQLAKLVKAIKFDIIFGRLRPRERLIEDELVEHFGVSRHVVRAAFVELERLGIVVRRPNRGAVVRDHSVREIDDLYDMLAHLLKEAAMRMPMPPSRDVIADLDSLHKNYCEAVAREDLP